MEGANTGDEVVRRAAVGGVAVGSNPEATPGIIPAHRFPNWKPRLPYIGVRYEDLSPILGNPRMVEQVSKEFGMTPQEFMRMMEEEGQRPMGVDESAP
jgi:hypothetical protein